MRVKGNLNRVIEEGMRYAFDEIDRPDLYAATRRERGIDPPEDEPELEGAAAAEATLTTAGL